MHTQDNMPKNNVVKRLAVNAMLVALAMIFSYVEAIIPFSVGIPGVKLGLANIVVLVMMYIIDLPSVFLILITRIILAGFMFGNLQMIIYSLAGGILSFVVMCIFKRLRFFSMVGVSILGGVSHNIGQLIVATVLVSNIHMLSLFPALLIAGTIAGGLVGIIGLRIKPIVRF